MGALVKDSGQKAESKDDCPLHGRNCSSFAYFSYQTITCASSAMDSCLIYMLDFPINPNVQRVVMVKYSTSTTLSVQIFSEHVPSLKQHTMERNGYIVTI